MPRSMTGFGQADALGYHIEVKGVNHRYKEIRIKHPKEFSRFEMQIRSMVQDAIGRGKVDVTISKNNHVNGHNDMDINWELARSSFAAIRQMGSEFGGEPSFRDVMWLPGVICESSQDIDEIWEQVEPAVQNALEGFTASKQAEGETLKDDLTARIKTLLEMQAKVARLAENVPEEYRKRLASRLESLLAEKEMIDESRLAQEVALLADKSDITEELVRLESHLNAFIKVLGTKKPDPIGRRLDFMLQEINREFNTIGAKSQLTEISHMVIEAKTEVEKIREQVQNIE